MKKLDQYIIRQFISILCFSIFGFLSVFVIVDLIENLDRFIDNNVPTGIVVQYYVYSLPYFISISLPMSMLISTIFSVGNIVKKNEWTAIIDSGISIYRLSIPLLSLGLVMSGLWFFMDNKLVSFGNEKRFEIDRDYVKRKSRHKLKNSLQDVFLQKDISIHISLTKYLLNNQTGYNLTWVDLGTTTIQKRIDATIRYASKGNAVWRFNIDFDN